jgi:site-specific DNA recombinase
MDAITANDLGAYTRVSTEKQADKTSPERQLENIQAWFLSEFGLEAPKHNIFEEPGRTGANLNRPALNRLLEIIRRTGQPRVIAMNTQDRMSRNMDNVHELRIMFMRLGVQAYCLNERRWVTTTDPDEAFMVSVSGYRAQKELDTMRDRLYGGKRYRIKERGEACWGNKPPYGFWPVKRPAGASGKIGTFLEIQEDEAEVCRLIRDLLLDEGLSVEEISGRLNQMGVPNPGQRRGRPGKWWPGRVYKILTLDTYFGEYHWGDLVVPVPPIFSEGDRRRIQARLKANYRFGRHDRKNDYLLTGLMKCVACGYTLSGIAPRKGDTVYRYYVCGGRMAPQRYNLNERCSGSYLRADEVEAVVWRHVVETVSNPKLLGEMLAQQEQNNSRHLLDEIGGLEARLGQIERDRRGLVLMRARGELDDPALLNQMIAELNDQTGATRQQRDSFQARLDQAQAWKDQASQAIEELLGWRDAIEHVTEFGDRREIVRALIDHITIDGDVAQVCYRLSPPGGQDFPSLSLNSSVRIDVSTPEIGARSGSC